MRTKTTSRAYIRRLSEQRYGSHVDAVCQVPTFGWHDVDVGSCTTFHAPSERRNVKFLLILLQPVARACSSQETETVWNKVQCCTFENILPFLQCTCVAETCLVWYMQATKCPHILGIRDAKIMLNGGYVLHVHSRSNKSVCTHISIFLQKIFLVAGGTGRGCRVCCFLFCTI